MCKGRGDYYTDPPHAKSALLIGVLGAGAHSSSAFSRKELFPYTSKEKVALSAIPHLQFFDEMHLHFVDEATGKSSYKITLNSLDSQDTLTSCRSLLSSTGRDYWCLLIP